VNVTPFGITHSDFGLLSGDDALRSRTSGRAAISPVAARAHGREARYPLDRVRRRLLSTDGADELRGTSFFRNRGQHDVGAGERSSRRAADDQIAAARRTRWHDGFAAGSRLGGDSLWSGYGSAGGDRAAPLAMTRQAPGIQAAQRSPARAA